MSDLQRARFGIAGSLARAFLNSKLTPLAVLASILLGLLAVALTPREEEPQIVVPMVDVLVPLPGASPREVESQMLTPLERRLFGLSGVEYLYGTARPSAALISLMAGEVAATLLSRVAVPVLYFLLARRGRAAELHREGAREAEEAAALASPPPAPPAEPGGIAPITPLRSAS